MIIEIASIPRGGPLAHASGMSKRFVYVLKNGDAPPRYYTGLTCDVATRYAEHNAGKLYPYGQVPTLVD